jgi:hypothetical protein
MNLHRLDAREEFLQGRIGLDIFGDEIDAFDVADPTVRQRDAAEAQNRRVSATACALRTGWCRR